MLDAASSKPVLRRLRRDMAGSSAYLDAVLERVRVNSVRFDGSGEALVHQTWKQYADGTPFLGLWVALDNQNQIIGHCLGDIQTWSGRTVAWITQVVMDTPAGMALKHEFLQAVDGWVVEANQWAKQRNPNWQNFNEVIMMSPRLSDAWARHSGFDEYRRVFRRFVR